jgi:hypothetical protein
MGTEVLWYKNIGFGFVNAERQMGEYVATWAGCMKRNLSWTDRSSIRSWKRHRDLLDVAEAVHLLLAEEFSVIQDEVKWSYGRLTSWCWVVIEKLIVAQLANKFSAFYGTRIFITLFARSFHWCPSGSCNSAHTLPAHFLKMN